MKSQLEPLASIRAGTPAELARPPWLPVGIVVLLAASSLLLVAWTSRQWIEAFGSAVTAVDNLSQSRIYAAEAQALAEKVLSGDVTVAASDVFAYFDRSFLSLADCREGASRLTGVPGLRPSNAPFLAGVDRFERALRQVRAATEERLNAGRSGPAPGIHQRQALHDLKQASADLDLRLAHNAAGQLSRQEHLLALLLGLWLAFAVGLTVLVRSSLRHWHEAERRVWQGHEVLRTVVECAPVAIVVLDRQRCVQLWNGFAEKMFGWRKAEVYGQPLPIVPAEEEAAANEFFQRQLEGLQPRCVELRRMHKDGTPIEVNLFPAPVLGPSDRIEGFVGVLTDVTEQKRQETLLRESEERYRRVVERSPVGIFVHMEGRFQYLNPEALRIVGASSPDELIGTAVVDRVHPDFAPLAAARMRGLFDDEAPVVASDEKWLRMDGRTILVEILAVPFRQGANRSALVFFSDVTKLRQDQGERRRLEEQFFQAQKMESVGRLAGGVAHDFNNLLTVINGYSAMLVDQFAEGDLRRAQVQEILQAGERAASLTRQLLAFSRKQVIEPVTLSLNQLVSDTEKLLRRLIGEDVELVTELASDLAPVLADPGQITQVLMNLAVNARDAMPEGGRIVITTSNTEVAPMDLGRYPGLRAGRYAQLTFRDDGVGMSHEVLEHLFEPFFTTKGHGAGTGLGLSTVYGIVTQSSGSIRVESAVGRGTEFQILLPARSGSTAVVESEAAAGAPGGHETVLVVEDNEEVRTFACTVLRLGGYTVLEAADPATALAMLETHSAPIDLLLSDVIMPGVTGDVLAAKARALRPGVRCVLMSGYSGDVIGRRGVVDEGTDFIQKPFAPDALIRKVRAVLDRSASA